MKTKAVRLYGKEDMRLEEFELPEMKEDEILAKVVSDSICMSTYKSSHQGTDHKRVPNDIATHPTICGHEFAGEIVKETDPLLRTKAACAATIAELRSAIETGNLKATRQDEKWLKRMEKSLAGIPDNADEFWTKDKPSLDLDTFRAGDYLLD